VRTTLVGEPRSLGPTAYAEMFDGHAPGVQQPRWNQMAQYTRKVVEQGPGRLEGQAVPAQATCSEPALCWASRCAQLCTTATSATLWTRLLLQRDARGAYALRSREAAPVERDAEDVRNFLAAYVKASLVCNTTVYACCGLSTCVLGARIYCEDTQTSAWVAPCLFLLQAPYVSFWR
jgi:hypothetical protein